MAWVRVAEANKNADSGPPPPGLLKPEARQQEPSHHITQPRHHQLHAASIPSTSTSRHLTALAAASGGRLGSRLGRTPLRPPTAPTPNHPSHAAHTQRDAAVASEPVMRCDAPVAQQQQTSSAVVPSAC
jgi:hypothetical protein